MALSRSRSGSAGCVIGLRLSGGPLLGCRPVGLAFGVRLRRRYGRQCRSGRLHAKRLVDLALDLARDIRVLAQVALHVVAALAQALVAVGEERAGLLDDPVLDPEVEDAALARDSGAVLDVELGLPERRGDLVLDDLDPNPVPNRLGALLEGLDTADIEPLRRVELERATAGLRFRGSKKDPNLLPNLVREDAER